jgi:hypothetical protein
MLTLITALATPLAILAGAWIHARISAKPNDAQRAELLSRIASEAAATALALFPKSDVTTLVAQVVKIIAASSGVPTTNATVIERAAYAAVTKLMPPPAVMAAK